VRAVEKFAASIGNSGGQKAARPTIDLLEHTKNFVVSISSAAKNELET
jgi:hypothetical protein